MKKILFASVAALLFSLSSMAQTSTPTPPPSDKKADMKDLRKDIRDLKKDKAERREEIREGDKNEAKEISKDIRGDKKDIKHVITRFICLKQFHNSKILPIIKSLQILTLIIL